MGPRRAHGDGTIAQQANGRFQGRLDLGLGPDGKRIRKSVSGGTRKEVVAKMQRLRRDLEGKEAALPAAKTATVQDALDLHLASQGRRLDTGRIKPRTLEYANECAARCAPISAILLKNLGPEFIEDWAAELSRKVSRSGTRGSWLALRSGLKLARRKGWLETDPMIDMKPPAEAPPSETVKCATKEDVAVILAASEEPWRTLWLVMAKTGVRPGESRGLRWENVDLNKKSAHIKESGPEETGSTKTRKNRTVHLQDEVVKALRVIHDEQGGPATGLIFPMALHQSNANKHFRKVAPKGLTPHSIRHGVATRMLDDGVPVHVAASVLGHSAAVLLATYAHSKDDAEAAALAAL
jgi:integrase